MLQRPIPLRLALLPLVVTIFILILLVFWLKLPLFLGLLAGTITACMIALNYGYEPKELGYAALTGMKHTQAVVIILLTIGALVAVWLNSGTVAGLIYYGLKLVHPAYFLVSAFLLASFTSMILGTSIGTLSTMGVALLGIGFSLGLPKPLIAGAVVSGALLGDRSSPMSSAANLVASATEVDFNRMLRYMLPTGVLGFGLSLGGYYILGSIYRPAVTGTTHSVLTTALAAYLNLNLWVLLPPALVIVLALMKIPTQYNLLLGVLVAGVIAAVLQKTGFETLGQTLLFGYRAHSGSEVLDSVLKGGGIVPMLSLILLILTAGAFNGILSTTGMLQQTAEKLLSGVSSVGGLGVTTVLLSTAVALVVCNQALPLLMPGQILKPIYQKRGLSPERLARTLTDSGLVIAALIPWNMLAVLASTAIGVPTLDYAPFALLLWILPILTILFGYLSPTGKQTGCRVL